MPQWEKPTTTGRATTTLSSLVEKGSHIRKRMHKIIINKIELFSYVRAKSIPPANEIEGYSIKIFIVPRSTMDSFKQLFYGSITCYSFYAGTLLIHASYLYSRTFINYLFGYRGHSVIGGCFTLKGYRGKGLYPNMLQRIAQENSKPIVIYVATPNLSSIKGIEKAGFIRDKKLTMYKFFGIPIYATQINVR